MNFTKLIKEEQLTILANVAEDKRIVDNAVEKDYWVSMVLRAIFSLPRCILSYLNAQRVLAIFVMASNCTERNNA